MGDLSRMEIHSSMEERRKVESMVKLIGVAGFGLGLCILVLLTDASVHQQGRRHEALIVGIVMCTHMLGSAFADILVLSGLAVAGVNLTNCNRHCKNKGSACKQTCDQENFESQPQSVRTFILSLL